MTTPGKNASALRVVLAAAPTGRRAGAVSTMIARSFAHAICVLRANCMTATFLALLINALLACAALVCAILVDRACCHATRLANLFNAQRTCANTILFVQAVAVAEPIGLAMASRANGAGTSFITIAVSSARQTTHSTLFAETVAWVTPRTRTARIATIVIGTWSITRVTRFGNQQL